MNVKAKQLSALRRNRKLRMFHNAYGNGIRDREPTWDLSGFREAFDRTGAADIVLSFGPSPYRPPGKVTIRMVKRRER